MLIREATLADADQLAILMGELGYLTTKEEMMNRLVKIQSTALYSTKVAEEKGVLVGMIGMMLGYHYEKNENYVRIVAFVVGRPYRNNGIGKKLLEQAVKWATEQSAGRLVLNSGNRAERSDAHQFYLRNGFEASATGFYKSLF